jgi:uncharacterized Zn-binding protein involved in type VI secretion
MTGRPLKLLDARMEALEPRLLLSGEGLLPVGADLVHAVSSHPEVLEVRETGPVAPAGLPGFGQSAVDLFAGLEAAPLGQPIAAPEPTHAPVRSSSKVHLQDVSTLTLEIAGAIKLTGTYTKTGDGSENNPFGTVNNMTVEFFGSLAGWQTTSTVSGVKLYTASADVPATTLTVTGNLGSDPTLMEFTGLQAAFNGLKVGFQADGDNRSGFTIAAGTVDVTASASKLFPAGTALTITTTGLTGGLTVESDATKLSLSAAELKIESGTLLTITAANAALTPLGDPLASIETANATVNALNSTGTVNGLAIARDGTATVQGATFNPLGTPQTVALGNILPFDIKGAAIKFAGDANGNNQRDGDEVWNVAEIALGGTGNWNFTKLGGLPWTASIVLGEGDSAQTYTAEQNPDVVFEGLLTNGQLAPKTLAQLSLGVVNLKAGEFLFLNGSLVLGSYQDGQWTPATTGSSLVLSGNPDRQEVTGELTQTPTLNYNDADKTLTFTAQFTASLTLGVSKEAESVFPITNATIDLNGVLTSSRVAGKEFELGLTTFTLRSTAQEKVEAKFAKYITLASTNVTLDLTATGDALVATVETLTASVEKLDMIKGTAKNFGIRGNGKFAGLPGFEVSLEMQPDHFKWPAFLLLRNFASKVTWKDFEADPGDLKVYVSGTFSMTGDLPFEVGGTVRDLAIDIGLLQEGKFPIVDLGELGGSVKGKLFGVDIEGAFLGGVFKVDANGDRLAPNDTTTPVVDRVFYGAIRAKYNFNGWSGFEIQLGISTLGPLQVYLSVAAPVVIEPTSGLAITNFRAGVTFNNVLPSITDARELRSSEFKPADNLTFGEWLVRLEISIANQVKSGVRDDAWAFFKQNIRIEGGCTVFNVYAGTATLSLDADVLISTDGKFVAVLRPVFADFVPIGGLLGKARILLYLDVSQAAEGKTTMLFLADYPKLLKTFSLYGNLSFEFSRRDGTPVSLTNLGEIVKFKIGGTAEVHVGTLVGAGIDGSIMMIWDPQGGSLDVQFDGKARINSIYDPLGVTGQVGVQGKLHLLQDANAEDIQIWGALLVTENFTTFERFGFFMNGSISFRLNNTPTDRTEPLQVAGRTWNVALPANSAGLLFEGFAYFQQGGVELFRMVGTLGFSAAANRLDVVSDAEFIVGPPENPFVKYKALGYYQASTEGIAGKVDLQLLQSDRIKALGFDLGGTFYLEFNTTGKDLTYEIPTQFPAVLGGRNVTIAAGLTNADGSAGPAGPYAQLRIQDARISVGGVTLSGTVLVALTGGGFQLTIPTNAPLQLAIMDNVSAGLSGFIKTDGSYDITGNANLTVGNNDLVGVNGTMAVRISNSVTPNFTTTLQGALFILGQNVATLNAAVTANNNTFTFTVNVNFTAGGGAVRVAVDATVTLAGGVLTVTWGGGATLWDRWNFNSTGNVSSAGTWTIDGNFAINNEVNLGIGGAKIEGTATVHFTNAESTVRASGKAEGRFLFITASVDFDVAADGEGVFSVTVAGTTINISIKDGLRIWSSDLGGSQLFIDRDRDGKPDKDEVGGTADGEGDFAFQDKELLAQYDLNGDHVLDQDEIGEFFDRLADFDTDQNGTLSRVEAKELLGDFGVFDLDGDNLLSESEVSFLGADFARFDVDHDGFLDEEEAKFASDFDYFDKNHDGQWDAAEAAPFLPSLATFDKDSNGTLDEHEAEGFFGWYVGNDGNDPLDRVITVLGGRDKQTGLINPLILRALGGDYGELQKVTASPLSTLQVGLIELGLDREEATRLLAEGLGLPPTVSETSLDPDDLPAPLRSQVGLVLGRSEQLITLVVNGAALLQAANPALSDFQAQSAIYHGLGYELYFTRVARHAGANAEELGGYDLPDWEASQFVMDADGQIVDLAGDATLSLADAVTTRNIIESAADETGTTLSDAQMAAFASVSADMNSLIGLLAGAGGADLKARMARAKVVTQNGTASALRQMGAGILGSEDVLQRYSATRLAADVEGADLPASGPLALAVAGARTLTAGTALVLPFDVTNVLGKASDLVVQVSSSNQDLVPDDQLQVSGDGLLRWLSIGSLAGHHGASQITLTVKDGERTATDTFLVGTAATIVSWASVQTHGVLGELGLTIPATGLFTEPRTKGVTKLVVKLDSPVDPASVGANSIRIAGVSGPEGASVDLAGVKVSVSLADSNSTVNIVFSQSLPDVARYRVLLSGVQDLLGNTISTNNERVFATLVGDASGDGVVNNTDIGGVRSLRRAGAIDPAARYAIRSDLNAGGSIANADVNLIYALRGHDVRSLSDPAGFGPSPAAVPAAAAAGSAHTQTLIVWSPLALQSRPATAPWASVDSARATPSVGASSEGAEHLLHRRGPGLKDFARAPMPRLSAL